MIHPDAGNIIMQHLFRFKVQWLTIFLSGVACAYSSKSTSSGFWYQPSRAMGSVPATEEVADEVVGVAVVAAPAKHIQANQRAIAACA